MMIFVKGEKPSNFDDDEKRDIDVKCELYTVKER